MAGRLEGNPVDTLGRLIIESDYVRWKLSAPNEVAVAVAVKFLLEVDTWRLASNSCLSQS